MLQSAQGFRYKSELNHEGFGVMEKIMGGKQSQNLAAKTEERISTKSGRKIKGLAALFTIVKTWKQHKCPSVDEWIKKMWYIYVHSAMK